MPLEPADIASIEFGVTNREEGLHMTEVGDSRHSVKMLDATQVLFFEPNWNYAYFFIDPEFKSNLGSNVVVTVEYRIVRGSPPGLQYDGARGRYVQANKNRRETSGDWDILEFTIPDARLQNSQNGRADFRVYDNERGFYLKRVTVYPARKHMTIAFQQRLLDRSKKRLGPAHTDTLDAMDQLATCYQDVNQMPEALSLHQQVLALKRCDTNCNPASLERSINRAAEDLFRSGKYGEAEPLYRELAQSRFNRLRPEHEDVIISSASLGRLLAEWAWTERRSPQALARATEAEELLRECLELRQHGAPGQGWRIGDIKGRLGFAMFCVVLTNPALRPAEAAARFGESEKLLLEGWEIMGKSRDIESKYKRDLLQRLVRFYETQTRAAEAAQWKEKLAALQQAEARQVAANVERNR
jgi:hypothetical protein